MTVSTQLPKRIHDGNDAATVFSFSPIVMNKATEIVVTHTTSAGAETTLSEGTGASAYSVQVTSYPGTGTITYPEDEVVPLPTGETLTIKRVTVLEQQTDLHNQGGYFSETHEDQFDKFVMIDLQQQEELDRSFRFPVSYDGGIPPITNAPVASGILRINAAKTAMEWGSFVTAGALVAYDTVPEDIDLTAGSAGVLADYARGDHVHLLPTVTIAKGGTGHTSGAPAVNADGGITLTDTDAGAGVGPDLNLFRDTASAADGDDIGRVRFSGRNDAGGSIFGYARVQSRIRTAADGAEDGTLDFVVTRAGNPGTKMVLEDGMVVGAPTGGDKGVGTVNAENGLYDNGALVVPGSKVWLHTETVGSSVATVDIEAGDFDWTAYDIYEFEFIGITVVTDDVDMYLRVYDTTLAAWQSGASDYKYAVGGKTSSIFSGTTNNSAAQVVLNFESGAGESIGNGATEHFQGSLKMFAPADGRVSFTWNCGHDDAANDSNISMGRGQYKDSNAVSGLRLLAQSGNIDGGKIVVYGIKTS